jgi:hypothetical protein
VEPAQVAVDIEIAMPAEPEHHEALAVEVAPRDSGHHSAPVVTPSSSSSFGASTRQSRGRRPKRRAATSSFAQHLNAQALAASSSSAFPAESMAMPASSMAMPASGATSAFGASMLQTRKSRSKYIVAALVVVGIAALGFAMLGSSGAKPAAAAMQKN